MPIMVFIVFFSFCIIEGEKRGLFILLALLYVFSTPLFSNYVLKKVEGDYEFIDMNSIKEAHAIVVLSGMMRINEEGKKIAVEWGDIDCFFAGLELYHANKSKRLVFTGGTSAYNKTLTTEGDLLKNYALLYGIHEDAILVTKNVSNTFDESVAVSELIGKNKTILLVTSAFHMKRAKQLFEKQGFTVDGYKVDFKTPPALTYNLIDFIPSAGALFKLEIALRELLGQLYYSI